MSGKPNILWIYCDELRADALGCYGNDQFQPDTPNIDSIAEAGVRFENCFCDSPVCVPSRVSVLTGLHPEGSGVYHNEGSWKRFQIPRPMTTFPEMFAARGYATADFGKLHVPPQMQPWQHRRPEGAGMKEVQAGCRDKDMISPGVGTFIGGRFRSRKPFPAEQVTRNALAWLTEADRPWLARLSYLQPHTPVCPPPPFDSLYPPASFRDHLTEAPQVSAFERRFAQVVAADSLTGEQIQLAQAYYYGLVAWIDSQVGLVLDFLRRTDQQRQTIVVFDSDHGASLGEGGCYAKHIFAPQVHRIPRLISLPGVLPAGTVRSDICQGLDLARTLFGLCGMTAPKQFRGRDLFADEAPEAVYSSIGFGLPDSKAFPNLGKGEYVGGRGWPRRACIRTAQYRLDCNVRIDGRPADDPDRDVFLTDRQADPAEQTNIAEDPAAADVRARLQSMLNEHVATALEPDPAVVRR
ncbi:MAG: hypothetical protein AMJ81_12385 [Phycisphaerae bacterium SM23_33]|nr:MAG: hypothetical protein AMJ81_12385 [Phycisphaerae bacterium SM23_33]